MFDFWRSEREFTPYLLLLPSMGHTEMRTDMKKNEEYTERFEAMLMPVLDEHGFELYDTEYVKEGSDYFLRAYIDKPGGITIDDCETVSRALSAKLDDEDFIPEAYILEVSSPGLGRQLKKDRHFQKSIGEEVEIKLFQGLLTKVNKKEVKQKDWRGILKGFDKENIYIEQEGEELKFDRKNIALIRLVVEF